MNHKAVFLDKDGTLIENVPYNVDPAQVRLAPGVADGVKLLHKAGYQLIVVSNQSGVAKGFFKEEDLTPVRERLTQILGELGAPLAGFYYCPHLPDAAVLRYATTCFCRKPSPGLLFQAARDYDLNLAHSWMIGDILNDVEAGRRADCRTVLIDNGNETEWKFSPLRRPHYTVTNFLEAAQIVLEADAHQMAPVPARPRRTARSSKSAGVLS